MSFVALGVLPDLAAALAREGVTEPSPVQRVAIPALLGGRSVIAVARTGSGKTFGYGVPVLQRLRAIEDAEGAVTEHARPRAVVLTGTRELVEQTTRALKAVAHGVRQRVRGVSGGMLPRQVGQQLRDPVDVLVANPTRLRALADAGTVRLDDVRVVVLDEGDTLCAPGQRPDVDALLARMPTAQLALFTATLPEPIRVWALALPAAPVLLLSKDAHAGPERIAVRNHRVRAAERDDTTHDILLAIPAQARGILFCNRRETADAVGAELNRRGHQVVVIHGGHLPGERKEKLAAFRAGDGRVLVTTELGGRGLHFDGLAFVVNWELPEKPSEYLHRIGRVGRQGARGVVHNLVLDGDARMLREIERLAQGGKLDTGEALRTKRERRAPTEGAPTKKAATPRGKRAAEAKTRASGGPSKPPRQDRGAEAKKGPDRSPAGGGSRGAPPPRRGGGRGRRG